MTGSSLLPAQIFGWLSTSRKPLFSLSLSLISCPRLPFRVYYDHLYVGFDHSAASSLTFPFALLPLPPVPTFSLFILNLTHQAWYSNNFTIEYKYIPISLTFSGMTSLLEPSPQAKLLSTFSANMPHCYCCPYFSNSASHCNQNKLPNPHCGPKAPQGTGACQFCYPISFQMPLRYHLLMPTFLLPCQIPCIYVSQAFALLLLLLGRLGLSWLKAFSLPRVILAHFRCYRFHSPYEGFYVSVYTVGLPQQNVRSKGQLDLPL